MAGLFGAVSGLAWLIFLLCSLSVLTPQVSYAQTVAPTPVFRIDSIPAAGGVLLDRGWQFRPDVTLPQTDNRGWISIDPTQEITTLPQVQRAGIGWFRLRIQTGQSLPPVMVHVVQSVASEVYLDGQLLYRFGTVSSDPSRVRASNPTAAYNLPLRANTTHLLTVRVAYQPGLDYDRRYLHWYAPALQLRLFRADKLPAIQPLAIESAYLDTFKVGIAFILFVLHLSLFIAYRRQRANLYMAGMYLLLTLTFLARTTTNFVDSVEVRSLLYYGAFIDVVIPGVAILIFYTLFDFRKGWPFWFALATVGLKFIPFPADYQWINLIFTYYLQLELVRISVIAVRRGLLGARIVTAGVLCNLGLWVFFSAVSAWVPFGGHEWLYHTLFVLAFLCIPFTLSLRLALEHGWVNRQLVDRLRDVEELSAQNVAEQQARQDLMARQNRLLEQEVETRTAELRQQADQLRELDEAKSRFVTNLTHEFRTPLSLIISPVAALLQSPALSPALSPVVQQSLQTIDRNARHLLSQVNQLLDISRLEAGQMAVNRQPVWLGAFTARLIGQFQPLAEASQLTLTPDLPGADGLYRMDTDKWGKILSNLLANALKFTPAGGQVVVSLRIEQEQVQLVVRDTGIGIAPEKLPLIFDRFYQADNHLTRSFEGTGVGLALVRELTDLLGGTITANSEPGVGSTFIVRLPVEIAPPTDWAGADEFPVLEDMLSPARALPVSTPDVSVGENGDTNTQPLVLIVEDNADLRAFITGELTTHCQVLTATNGQQGWELAQQHLPDVVISDVMMPEMDGFALTRLLKTTPATDHIAVVLLTARSMHESRLEGLQHGADEYLTKPFDMNELQLRLANLMTRQQKLQAYYRRELAGPNSDWRNAVDADTQVSTRATESSSAQPDRTRRDTAQPDPFLQQVFDLLETHLDNPTVGVEWLAVQLAMDRKTLYRKLQSKLRLSPNSLIRAYRLRRAGELLRAGKSVTETAYSVGFESVTYFGQCFREQYQVTPTEFVNQLV